MFKQNREILIANPSDTLKAALFRGGLTQETMDILLSGQDSNGHKVASGTDNELALRSEPHGFTSGINTQFGHPTPIPSAWSTHDSGYFSKPIENGQRHDSLRPSNSSSDSFRGRETHHSPEDTETPKPRSAIPKHDQRTLILTNLADQVTYEDLVNVLHGGRIVDIHLRRKDKAATVSFAEGALEFLHFAKRHDIYIRNKRVEIKWHDRQFRIPPHVANQMAGGATRNLVIRGGAARLSESSIRTDMEHIHNLVVISVHFKGGDAYVSMNSVHNCLYARTCMMSRSVYKGLKIEWYPDECARPLPAFRSTSYTKPVPTGKENIQPIPINRFSLLDLEGSDDESEEEGSNKAASTPAAYGHGVRLSDWSESVLD